MKKRILFINGHLNAGGVERSLVDVLRHFDYDHFDVDLMLLEDGGDYLKEVPAEVNTHTYHLNDASGPFLQSLWRLLRDGKWQLFLFRIISTLCAIGGYRWLFLARPIFPEANRTYDAVIAYRPERPTYFAAYLLKGKKKISWWHHGALNLTEEQVREHYTTYEKMDSIIAVSNCSSNILKSAFPNIIDRISVIPNMVCTDEIQEKAKELNPTMREKGVNIISVGRFSPEKNMAMCIEIASILKQYKFDFHWYLVGDGEQEQYIKNRIRDKQLMKDITLTGRLPNPYPYIRQADLFFHPSPVESQGLTILEAIALGKPVISVISTGAQEFNNRNEITLIQCDATLSAQAIMSYHRKTTNAPIMLASPADVIKSITSLLN